MSFVVVKRTSNSSHLFSPRHGPPGTGKTTILKGLAQKIAIRLGSRYDAGHFVEVNAHSLFSKWFSESGKLVTKMFNKITEIVEDRSLFVCVLIDEVESLTAARQAAANGTEPSDAIRVVNAVSAFCCCFCFFC